MNIRKLLGLCEHLWREISEVTEVEFEGQQQFTRSLYRRSECIRCGKIKTKRII